MNNLKLFQDFGVTALFGTIILLGSFAILIIGVVKDAILMTDLLPLLGSWVSGIASAYLVIKAKK